MPATNLQLILTSLILTLEAIELLNLAVLTFWSDATLLIASR